MPGKYFNGMYRSLLFIIFVYVSLFSHTSFPSSFVLLIVLPVHTIYLPPTRSGQNIKYTMAHNMLLQNNSEECRPCWYCVIKNPPHMSDFSVSAANIHYQFLTRSHKSRKVLLAVWWSSFPMLKLGSTGRIFLKRYTGDFIGICLENSGFLKLCIPLCVEICWMQWITTSPSTQLNSCII
jgi:hypothetical protein